MKSKQVPIILNTHQPIEPKKEGKHKIYEKLENKVRVGEKEKLTQKRVKAKGEKNERSFGCVDSVEVMIRRLVSALTGKIFFFSLFLHSI